MDFKLDVYNDKVKMYLHNPKNITIFLNSRKIKKSLGKNHQEMIQTGWINNSWIDFIQWYNGGWKRFLLIKDNYLFRGIENYTWSSLRKIVRTGNDRLHKSDNSEDFARHEYILKNEYGLTPEQVVWATSKFWLSWSFANKKFAELETGIRVIIIYQGELLESLPGSDNIMFKVGPRIKSFEEALVGIIRINYV